MLTSRVTTPSPPSASAEDIFSSSQTMLFADDVQVSHGTPGDKIIYTSPRYGPLIVHIPTHPSLEEGRELFAHYLWNAAVIAADLIETASNSTNNEYTNSNPFNVHSRTILELGAGTALPSLISALAGAKSITVTDHPESPSITNNTITTNMHTNLRPPGAEARSKSSVQIAGHVWGTPTFYSASHYGVPLSTLSETRYDRLLICDCLWMPSQHSNLITSIVLWLSRSSDSSAIVIAGFHTGRSTVRDFFSLATASSPEHGALRLTYIDEIDVNGHRREWAPERTTETKEQAKQWCVVGILQRR